MRFPIAALSLASLVACEDFSLAPAPVYEAPVVTSGCTKDSDCARGTCDANGVCDERGCRSDDACAWGICGADNRCDEYHCRTDGDCHSNVCVLGSQTGPGYCGNNECQSDSDCRDGKFCFADPSTRQHTCVAVPGGCRSDEQCPCGTCVKGGGSDIGSCVTQSGPPVLGTPTALRMTDNLRAAIDFVHSKFPDAFLTQITGLGLKANGTVDITANYTSQWIYAFQLGDGASAPPKMLTVTYYLMATKCASFTDNASSVSPSPAITDAEALSFRDSPQLVEAFLAQPGCVAPVGDSSDVILYKRDASNGFEFLISTWKSHLYRGDPVTGAATAYCQSN